MKNPIYILNIRREREVPFWVFFVQVDGQVEKASVDTPRNVYPSGNTALFQTPPHLGLRD